MTKRIRTLIVDDEAPARRRLRKLLEAEPDITLAGECGNGQQALDVLQNSTVDLVFLDVQMPRMSGLEMLSRLGAEIRPVVVFVTAYDQYAIQAFESDALDYLLKPYDDERFQTALRRARTRVEQQDTSYLAGKLDHLLEGLQPDARYASRFSVRSSDGRIRFVKASDVGWFEADGKYVRLHVGPKVHLIRLGIAELEKRLDPATFVRIHRSTIVNVDWIAELQPWGGGEFVVVLQGGTKLRSSRGCSRNIQQLIQGGGSSPKEPSKN